MKKSRLMIAGSAISLALFASLPAFAQDAPGDAATAPEDEEEAEEEAGQPILVTGSRIRRPNVESNLPVTTLGGEEFFQQGQTNIGDTLNELPQLRSTFAQQNPGLGIGIAGLNLLDLRGLGTVRTLVLVNGRRHVAADILNNAVSPDVNTIPNDLIERVDIVTGGNSAIYGSDAIAGVVNFILRRDYEGVQIRGNAAMSEEGFGGNQYASILAGQNFADGRGNVTAHFEFANQERIFGSDIPNFRRVDGFVVADIDTGGLVSNNDGFPDSVFARDLRSASIHRFGLIPVTQPTLNPLCGTGLAATNGGPGTTGGLPYNCTLIFNAAGRLTAQTGTRTGAGIIGGIIGGNGQTGREGQILSVLPSLRRLNANLLARFEFSEALELFAEGKATRVNIRGSNFGPSFVQGTFGTLDFRERTRLDNPFLNPADRATLTAAILASGFNTDLLTRTPLTPANLTAIANGSYRFVTSRLLTDAGNRDEEFERDTLRVVGGLRGTFNDDWSYEVSANYGITKERTTAFGFIDRQRASLAWDAGIDPLNPAAGIQCRARFDPASALPLQAGGYQRSAQQIANNAARLAADIAACIPYNPFGAADNRASVDYFSADYKNFGSLDQLVISGFASGDTSDWFELPGGPVRFAAGGEYRREKLQFRQDPLVFSTKTNAVEIPDILPAAFKVKEAFAEIQIPLLKDTPFFEDLTLSGAGRVADYQGGVGTVYAYNGGIEWSPIQDIKFRANYGRSVRAPNVSETAAPLVANFATFQDPCMPQNINGAANRAANCLADLGAGPLAAITNRTYSLGIISGSNPNLQAEESDSYTIGAVIQPRFIPGLSLTVDYYDITLNGQIASVGAQGIVNSCYDQPNLNNIFCSQFQRNRTAGPGPNGEQGGAVIENSLINSPLNFARRVRRGVDFEVAYRTEIGSNAKLNTRLIYSHQLENSNFESSTNPNFENRLLDELGDPQDEFRWNVDLTLDKFTIGYEMRYIGSMLTTTYENLYPLNGNPPGNLDAFDIRRFPAVFYHDVRIDLAAGKDDNYNFFLGVDNILDTQPPLGSTATGVGSAIYSIRGRNFFAGFKAKVF